MCDTKYSRNLGWKEKEKERQRQRQRQLVWINNYHNGLKKLLQNFQNAFNKKQMMINVKLVKWTNIKRMKEEERPAKRDIKIRREKERDR